MFRTTQLHRRTLYLALTAISLIVLGGVAWSQTFGTILGSVTDPTGSSVVTATVTIINEATGAQRSIHVDDAGDFNFPSVVPGSYTVRIESPGFQKFERKANILSASERLALGKLQLTVGSVTETVSVVAQGAQIQSASSESSSLLTSNQIDKIALKGRVLMNYILLVPGVYTAGGTQDSASGLQGVPNANGLPATMLTMTTDGMQGSDLGSQNLFINNMSPDAVEEIKVLANNYQAEYGRNGSVTVNIITKSGTKDFTGSVYWYKRHEMFNANSFFNNRNGQAKAKYRYNTTGAAIGGPISIPKLFNRSREKLFFFYNYDSAPNTGNNTGTKTMPTALERTGDYSKSTQPNGTLIDVQDPLNNHIKFPGNVIPTSRINKQGQILLNVFALPNFFDTNVSKGNYNYTFQTSPVTNRIGHIFRIDYRPNSKDSLYFRGQRTKYETNGSPLVGDWQFVFQQTGTRNKNGVFGWTHVLSPTMVNEFTFGARRPQEYTSAENDKGFRKTNNFTLGMFNPQINYFDLLPQVSFSGAGLQNLPDFGGWDAGRWPRQENDLLTYFTDGFSVTKSRHLFKFGIYAERDRIQTGSGFTTNPTGSFNFGVNANWPDDTKHPYASALLGLFQTYSESTTRTLPAGVADNIDWYAQDSWKVRKNLTLEIGLRVAFYTQWYGWHGQATAFAFERYKQGASPLLFQPVRVNNTRYAQNPVTKELLPQALIGQFVPGTGDPANGTLTSKDQNFPKGFINNPGELFQPRFGFAWDVFGTGKTAVRGGLAVQNNLLRYEPNAAGAPISYTPTYYYGNFDTLFSTAGYLAPGSATGHDTNRPTPRIYNISFGVQQDVGHSTVVDAKYVSTLGRNLSNTRNPNTLPYGARFLPQNQDPSQTTVTPLSDSFLRPIQGWNSISIREAGGSSNYHALQVAANRRYTQGIQFGLAYTYSKAMDYGGTQPIYRSAREFAYGPSSFDQTHILTVNYTYQIPGLSKLVHNSIVKYMFDDWLVSGITSYSSGTPNRFGLTLSDGVDLVGGGDGNQLNLIGKAKIAHSEKTFERQFDPGGPYGATSGYVSTVVARPAKGNFGNQGVGVLRNPGLENNWDLTIIRDVRLKSERRMLEFRWEFYNILNHTQFSGMNTSATFDAAGRQTNNILGQATTARTPRQMQVSMRLRF